MIGWIRDMPKKAQQRVVKNPKQGVEDCHRNQQGAKPHLAKLALTKESNKVPPELRLAKESNSGY